MAKNFSVQWLSQSFYTKQTELNDVEVTIQSPRSQKQSEGLKQNRSETRLHIDLEELTRESRKYFTSISPNNNFGYTSGYESEVADDNEGEAALSRRMRTKFTCDQIYRLEKTFDTHKYLGSTQRRKIADKLGLSENQVKTWFQNRRMKLKREVGLQQDVNSDFVVPTSMLPLLAYASAPKCQHHIAAGQHPTYNQAIEFHPPPRLSTHLPRLPIQNGFQQPPHPLMLSYYY